MGINVMHERGPRLQSLYLLNPLCTRVSCKRDVLKVSLDILRDHNLNCTSQTKCDCFIIIISSSTILSLIDNYLVLRLIIGKMRKWMPP